MFNSNKPKPLKGHKSSLSKDFWLFGTGGLQSGELCQLEVTKWPGQGRLVRGPAVLGALGFRPPLRSRAAAHVPDAAVTLQLFRLPLSEALNVAHGVAFASLWVSRGH